jgi:hypothetical protein
MFIFTPLFTLGLLSLCIVLVDLLWPRIVTPADIAIAEYPPVTAVTMRAEAVLFEVAAWH